VLVTGWVTQCLLIASVKGHTRSVLTVAIGVLTATILALAMFSASVGGTGANNIFSWHPVFMGLAFLVFMTSGQLAYKPDALSGSRTKSEVRRWHAALMGFGMIVAFGGGYVTIFVAHAQNGESQLGVNETTTRFVHVWMGYATLACVAMQALTGVRKVLGMWIDPEHKSFRWHGTSGVLLLLLAYATTMLGFWLPMNRNGEGWGFALKLTLTAFVAALAGCLVLDRYVLLPQNRQPPSCAVESALQSDRLDKLKPR